MRNLPRVMVIAASVTFALQVAPASASTIEHCAVELVPVGVSGAVIESTPHEIGCYATYAEALAAGSDGAIDVSSSATPASLTQDQLDASTTDALTSVLIGTEWVSTGYTGSSNSYFGSQTCSASVTWEVGYVGDTWNDRFDSGKGFGGCDLNRKFHDSQFGGTSVLCTPNCSTYGALNNEVSSLRWRH